MENQQPTAGIRLPPGFRFHPSDEELIQHYLRNKVTSSPLPAYIIAEIDLYKYNPWELPKKALFGEDEWYFFTPRDRKYPNGVRPNRAAGLGYWKATGTDKPVLTSCGAKSIGVKKALVFYKGRPPKGVKTDWIMHEYRSSLDTMIWTAKAKGSMRLDDWVLCRVRQKCGVLRNMREDRNGPSYEPPVHVQKVDEPWSMNVHPTLFAAVRNYLYNDPLHFKGKWRGSGSDCAMLPYFFASQNIPCTDTAASISFQSSNGGKLCPKDDTAINQSQYLASFNSLPNPLKRKPAEGNHNDIFVFPSKKVSSRDIENEEVEISKRNDSTAGMKFCGTDPPQDNDFDAVQWNSFNPYQELDDQFVYTGSSN